ncbi:MAG TPA: apolipoprotein N-acyltransferase, partial [Mycobacterium sp.]
MAKGNRRFDRRKRPGEVTEVIPAVDDDDTGVIPAVDDDDDFDQEPEPRADGNRVLEIATHLGHRLIQLAGALLVWLGDELRRRLPQFGRALRPRLTRLGAAIVAGLLLCSSYPGFNWWWAAVIAFALLAWVLTHSATSPPGGFGYGFLFGLAFYPPLIHWVSILVGATPLLALVTVCALFPGLFGLLAVVVRRLPGWPIWFAVLWAAQEWLKSTVPFGGFPWGVVAAGQTEGPFLPLVRLGGVPLLSLAIVLVGCSATAIALEIASWL